MEEPNEGEVNIPVEEVKQEIKEITIEQMIAKGGTDLADKAKKYAKMSHEQLLR